MDLILRPPTPKNLKRLILRSTIMKQDRELITDKIMVTTITLITVVAILILIDSIYIFNSLDVKSIITR